MRSALGGFEKTNHAIQKLEAQPFHYSLTFVFTWIFLRIFWEGIFEAYHKIGYADFSYPLVIQYLIHFPFFYLSLFLVLVITISLLISESILKVTAVASIGLGLILLVPIIDWVNSGYVITYPLRLKPFLCYFLNPVKSLTPIGISPGQRIIILLITLLIAIYGYQKKRKLLISLLLFIISLGLILLWGALPTLIALDRPEKVYLIGGILKTDQQKFSSIFAVSLFFSFVGYSYMLNKDYFRILIKSWRLERMLFYSGIGIFGFILAMRKPGLTFNADFFNLLGLILLVFSLGIGFQSAQVINDFFDLEADRISRKRNPLGQGLNRVYYSIFGFCLVLLSLSFALILNYSCFLLMISYLLLSVIYSVPPVRLKQFPLLATFVLAVAAILAMAMGYSLIYDNQALNAIPKTILIPTLLGITFGFIAKDIKDLEGDRSTGVITLPGLIYRNSIIGRLPVAILIGISYLFYIIFIPKVLIGAIISSILTILYTIFNKQPREWFYFAMLYFFGTYLLIILLNT